jgi:tetratricopeptide (TPR) repeat protein
MKSKTDSALEKARIHLEQKQYKNARLMYFQAFNQVSEPRIRAIIWAELSWVYYYEGDYIKAIEAAENVLLHDENYRARDDLFRLQGYAYIAQKNTTLAERFLTQSLSENSTDDKQQYVKYELAKLHFSRGNYDLAYPLFEDVLDFFARRDADYKMSVLFFLGFVCYYLESFAKARGYFEQILSDDPPASRKASGFFGLAFVEFHDRNYLNVISLCEKIMSLAPDFFDRESVAFLTAASYFHLGRLDIFNEYSRELIKAFPNGRYLDELKAMQQKPPDQSKAAN